MENFSGVCWFRKVEEDPSKELGIIHAPPTCFQTSALRLLNFRDRETGVLKSQIGILRGTIKREEEKADDLELKSKMFSYGEFKAEDQEKMLRQLHRKVEEVFKYEVSFLLIFPGRFSEGLLTS